jgi:deoxyribose-phosphate aldolase
MDKLEILKMTDHTLLAPTGIKTFEQADALITAGASRIGASSLVSVFERERADEHSES